MQIQNGTCEVTNGSPVVIANDVDWSDAIEGGLFSVPAAQTALFVIDTIAPPGTSTSGFWEITLSVPYSGPTNADANYQITIDFTPNRKLTLINRGDVETAKLVNESMRILDEDIAELMEATGAAETSITLAAHSEILGSLTNYRITADFSATASFSTATFRQRCTATPTGVVIIPEENKRTPGKASWLVFTPDFGYGETAEIAFSALLRGVWPSATVTNVPATWFVETIASGEGGGSGLGYNSTSTSVNSITLGEKTFTLTPVGAYVPGIRARFISTLDPENWVEGEITDITTGVATVAVNRKRGAGVDLNSWDVSVAGEPVGEQSFEVTVTIGADSVDVDIPVAFDEAPLVFVSPLVSADGTGDMPLVERVHSVTVDSFTVKLTAATTMATKLHLLCIAK